jgi:cytochrome c-type biogenesis protein CcmH/NrfG
VFAVFLGAVFAGLRRTARRGRESVERRLLAVAAGGAFTAWLAHTSVDWLHNLPGVTAIALAAAAALVAPWTRSGGRSHRGVLSSRRIAVIAVAGVAVLAAADSIGRLALADHYRIAGRDKLQSNPVDALRIANRALAFNGQSVPALYIKSAAYARLGSYEGARAALVRAIQLEPYNAASWVLLGDIAVRRGDLGAARRAYDTAVRLDPKDDLIRSLAQNPRAVLSQGG